MIPPSLFLPLLSLVFFRGATALPYQQSELTPEYVLRDPSIKFENLAVRSNGQILTTSTRPNASIYQVDPRGKLPITLVHTISNISSATGITEGAPDVFYVASGVANVTSPLSTVPSSYVITEIDMRGVCVLPNGVLSKEPATKHVASIPDGALLNGVAMARQNSEYLLVADSYRGLVWNVNIKNGSVGVALNDTTTKGTPEPTSPTFVGINGLKVYNDTMWWTVTGRSSLYNVPIDEFGRPQAGQVPKLVASKISCDDFAVDAFGNAYVAGPLNVLTKVTPNGQAEIVAGTFNSTSSDLGGPTAVRFGRRPSDHNSLYISLDGGLLVKIPDSAGIVRLDLA